jgi:hypothetical protein
MFNTIVGAGSVRAGAASRYGSGSDQMMRLLAAPAPQHWVEGAVIEEQSVLFRLNILLMGHRHEKTAKTAAPSKDSKVPLISSQNSLNSYF